PGARVDVRPRQHDGPLLPRLAGQDVVADVHDAVLVDDLAVANHELVWIDDDGRETGVAVEPELEYRHGREQRDPRAHYVVEGNASGRLDGLLVQEEQRERSQARLCGLVVARRERRRGDGRRPDVVGDRAAGEHAPTPPAPKHDGSGACSSGPYGTRRSAICTAFNAAPLSS